MSVGLVIEGGGMRGIFAAGIIDYMLDNDILIKNVIGVSAGACHACSYVTGQRGRAFYTATAYLDDPAYCGWGSWIKTGDFFGSDFIYRRIPDELYKLDKDGAERRGIRFQAALTNCATGKAEYPDVPSMDSAGMQYVRASSSVPLLAKPVELPEGYGSSGGKYMDGGISDSIPIRQSELQGNDKNIVILTRPKSYRKKPGEPLWHFIKFKYRKYPKMIKALERRAEVYNSTLEYIEEGEKSGKILAIRPEKELDIGLIEKSLEKYKKAYDEGYKICTELGQKLIDFVEK